MRALRYLFFLLGALLLILVYEQISPYQAEAASCTPGVNCYCDRVKNSADPLFDPSLVWCEDWDHNEWYRDGPGAWYQGNAGTPNWNRGDNSRWRTLYGFGAGCLIPHGAPTSPRLGQTCNVPGFSSCTGGLEYVSLGQGNAIDGRGRDAWGPGVNPIACVDIIGSSGDIADEVTGLTLTRGNSGGGAVFEGNHAMAYRIGPGQAQSILGEKSWSARTEIGITMALAYSSNIGSVTGAHRIIEAPWKHDEWGSNPWMEFWNLGNTGTAGEEQFPYSPFMFHNSQSGCNSSLAGATVRVGTADCTGVALRMGASPSAYIQSRDFPFGTWGCHQGHIKGMGTSNMEVKLSHNGVVVFHMTGFNSGPLVNKSYGNVFLNPYANANQGTGETPTTQTVYRYQDNIHVRNGAPVSCAQIGFTGTGDTTPPAAPASLRITRLLQDFLRAADLFLFGPEPQVAWR